MIDARGLAVTFRWTEPLAVELDPWVRCNQWLCVAVGVVGADQVIARVFEDPIKPQWERERMAQVVCRESDGGKRSLQIAEGQLSLATLKERAVNYLFGVLRDWVVCSVCGHAANTNYIEPTKTRLIANQMCFTCDHWAQWIEKRKMAPGDYIVVGGTAYHIVPDEKPSYHGFVGHGGALFRIKRGDVVSESRNLWNNGRPSKWWRDRIPDDATFVHE